jgi:hypothetical protein
MFTPRSAPDGPPPITQRPQTGGRRRDRRGRQSVQTSRVPTLSCCRTYLVVGRTYLVVGPLADATRHVLAGWSNRHPAIFIHGADQRALAIA